jgi:hypothetical protein
MHMRLADFDRDDDDVGVVAADTATKRDMHGEYKGTMRSEVWCRNENEVWCVL